MQRRRIRIAHLIYNLDIERGGGGISRFAIELCRSIDRDNFDVRLYSLWNTGTIIEQRRIQELIQEGLNTVALTNWDQSKPYQSFLDAVKSLIKINSKEHFDIVHSQSEFSDIAAIILKLFSPKIRIIRTIQYGYSLEWRKRPLRRVLFTNLLFPLLYDIEIGVNQEITDRLNQRSLSSLRSKRAINIHNGVSLTRFRPIETRNYELLSALKIPEDAPVIGTVGRLVEQKGYAYFIQAVKIVLAKLPNSYFLIIGDGELKAKLVHLAKSLGVESNILFIAPQTDIYEYYSIMTLFVSSSLWEGLPNVILESMACGTPIVATDIPGTREVIQHDYNGWLVSPADQVSLAQSMIALIKSPNKRYEFINNAHDTIRAFSIEAIAKQYESTYLSCLGIDVYKNH